MPEPVELSPLPSFTSGGAVNDIAAPKGRPVSALTTDFREFLRLLNANRVDYLLVGGYAVGVHGYPRATVDLDIWIRAIA